MTRFVGLRIRRRQRGVPSGASSTTRTLWRIVLSEEREVNRRAVRIRVIEVLLLSSYVSKRDSDPFQRGDSGHLCSGIGAKALRRTCG